MSAPGAGCGVWNPEPELCGRTLKLRRSWRRCATSGARTPKMNMLSSPISSAISTFAPSIVPMMRLPFIANFMLLVPLASVPAVLMCWLSSHPARAGDSALEIRALILQPQVPQQSS